MVMIKSGSRMGKAFGMNREHGWFTYKGIDAVAAPATVKGEFRLSQNTCHIKLTPMLSGEIDKGKEAMRTKTLNATESDVTINETLKARILAVALGTAMLFVVGFAYSTPVHNAAHDTRHTLAFPCH
jgi:cobalt transporter subunit CbtB